MQTIVRHWRILRMIPRHSRIDATTIHEKLEDTNPFYRVSRRTIERDLHQLIEAGFLLEFDNRKPQGWRWRSDAEGLECPAMDLTTALTFHLVEAYLSPKVPQSCLLPLAPYLKRARTLLSNLKGEEVGGWPSKIKVISSIQSLLPPQINPNVIRVVYKALFAERRFKATYHHPQKGRLRYEISPLGIVCNGPEIWLAATCWDHDSVRLLALHRMSEAVLLEMVVQRPEDFDLDEFIYTEKLGFVIRSNRTIHLKALFTADAAQYLGESPLSSDQQITNYHDGRVLIQAEVSDTELLRRWLLGFGDQVEVLAPNLLRQEFGRISETMFHNYQMETKMKQQVAN